MCNYAINLIEREINLIEKCLSDWESREYPEAKKERQLKLNELNKALETIKNELHIPK